ncbi:MAG: histidine kinase [Blastocatellia bacterium]
MLPRIILIESFTGLITYAVIVVIFYAFDYYRKFRERELRAAQLEGRLAQAELQNLKTQLQPHFLFNTLHAISVLMQENVPAANRMLVRLSELLRMTLDTAGAQQVTLKQEMEFAQRYLEIEQTRFQDRLSVKTVVDPATLDARVPSLLLQPLVENAVRHGIARRAGAGLLEIRAQREEDVLRLQVRDNGPGLQTDANGEIEIIGESANGLEAVAAIQKLKPDLVFLDVQMPEMDGFEVIEAVGVERMPRVIFVTAYDQYTLRAFEVHALDYLLKPFDRERFLKALNYARSSLDRGEFNRQLVRLLDDRLAARKPLERLVIKSGGRIYFLNVEEVDWIEAADNYVELHVGRESHLLRETISGLAARLDPARFLRIRHSTIVNLERVKELRPLFRGEFLIVLRDGTELTSSRRYRKNLDAILAP